MWATLKNGFAGSSRPGLSREIRRISGGQSRRSSAGAKDQTGGKVPSRYPREESRASLSLSTKELHPSANENRISDIPGSMNLASSPWLPVAVLFALSFAGRRLQGN